ncbi:MAG: hypothetical protein E7647_01750 [Ruminococcaceae bacterium]|nr:hypothetical protein [Oscillospiraceae bacterium]
MDKGSAVPCLCKSVVSVAAKCPDLGAVVGAVYCRCNVAARGLDLGINVGGLVFSDAVTESNDLILRCFLVCKPRNEMLMIADTELPETYAEAVSDGMVIKLSIDLSAEDICNVAGCDSSVNVFLSISGLDGFAFLRLLYKKAKNIIKEKTFLKTMYFHTELW